MYRNSDEEAILIDFYWLGVVLAVSACSKLSVFFARALLISCFRASEIIIYSLSKYMELYSRIISRQEWLPWAGVPSHLIRTSLWFPFQLRKLLLNERKRSQPTHLLMTHLALFDGLGCVRTLVPPQHTFECVCYCFSLQLSTFVLWLLRNTCRLVAQINVAPSKGHVP